MITMGFPIFHADLENYCEYLQEGEDQGKNHPDVNHLHIGRGRQALRNTNKAGSN